MGCCTSAEAPVGTSPAPRNDVQSSGLPTQSSEAATAQSAFVVLAQPTPVFVTPTQFIQQQPAQFMAASEGAPPPQYDASVGVNSDAAAPPSKVTLSSANSPGAPSAPNPSTAQNAKTEELGKEEYEPQLLVDRTGKPF